MNQSLNNRLFYIDVVKTISIIGVVYIHSSGILKESSLSNDFVKACFRFGVPCFVLFWAYFLELGLLKREKSEHIKYLLTKFFALFKVYFIWSVLYFLVNADFHQLSLNVIIKHHFIGFGWQGQYFFIVLFQLLFLFPFLRNVYLKKFLLAVLIITILITYFFVGYRFYWLPSVIKKIGYSPFIYWIPYVLVGIALARKEFTNIGNWLWVIVLLTPIEAICFIVYNIQGFPYVSLGVLFGSIALSTVAITKSLSSVKSPTILKLISFIAKNTMVIFVANPFFVMLFKHFFPIEIMFIYKGGNFDVILLNFVISLLILILCLVFANILRKSRLEWMIN